MYVMIQPILTGLGFVRPRLCAHRSQVGRAGSRQRQDPAGDSGRPADR